MKNQIKLCKECHKKLNIYNPTNYCCQCSTIHTCDVIKRNKKHEQKEKRNEIFTSNSVLL
jgi:hypothetical protein